MADEITKRMDEVNALLAANTHVSEMLFYHAMLVNLSRVVSDGEWAHAVNFAKSCFRSALTGEKK